MSIRRTSTIEVNKDFTFDGGEVVKSWTDADGTRYVRGVASGVKVDRDGERVSRNGIAKMAAQAAKGGIKLTSSHLQDWATEIGDVVKAVHDAETDELIVDCKLPVEGMDPLADKAWNRLNVEGAPLGFSIGGKLRKAFYEVAEVGKRKVLDEIDLRHVALTAKPAYTDSFAHAVAKSLVAEPEEIDALPVFDVEDEDTPLDDEQVIKGLSPSTQGQGGDSKTGDRNAGFNKKGNRLQTEDPDPDEDGDKDAPAPDPDAPPTDDDPDAEQDPEDMDDEDRDAPSEELEADQEAPEPDARHIACPNCGHEFAVALPSEGDMTLTEDEEAEDESDQDENPTEKPTTRKTAAPEEKTMALKDTLEMLEGVVAKKSGEEAEAPTADTDTDAVDKTTDEPSDIAKMVAASHETLDARLSGIEESLGTAFGLVAKAIQDQQAALDDLPVGRKSIARILPPRSDIDGGDEGDAGQDLAKQIEDAPDALSALKTLNKAHYGIQ